MAEDNKKRERGADDFEDDFQEEAIYSDNETVIEDDHNDTIGLKRKANTEEQPKKKKKKQQKKKKVSTNPFDTIDIWKENTAVQAEYLADHRFT
ncbi:hypothetical protein RMATCC62417_14312 [Rhizopus microsporus]|nr:hypothetical protein RMATCC62417_14312 [Rhizopus microsporus]